MVKFDCLHVYALINVYLFQDIFNYIGCKALIRNGRKDRASSNGAHRSKYNLRAIAAKVVECLFN